MRHRSGASGRAGTLAIAVVIAIAVVAGIVGFSASRLAGAQTATPTGAPAPSPAPVAAPVDGVAYGPLPEQRLDVHLPTSGPTPGPSVGVGPFPVIIYMHSGGWVGGSRAPVPDAVLSQVGRGIAVVSIDYRVATNALDGSIVNAFPVPDTDVDRAIRFVKVHAASWNLDRNRVLLAGASAGGHLAALAAAAPGAYVDPTLPADLAGTSPRVNGVLDFIGPSDFTTFPAAGGWAPGLTTKFLDCPHGRVDQCDPAIIAAASVATHLDASAPPAFFAYGSHDGLVIPATQGIPLADAWAHARGETQPPTASTPGVAYDQTNSGHTIDNTVVDLAAMQTWLDATLAPPVTATTVRATPTAHRHTHTATVEQASPAIKHHKTR